MRAQPPEIDDPERRLILRQADQARDDFAAILDELALLRGAAYRLPTRAEVRCVLQHRTGTPPRGCIKGLISLCEFRFQ
jgi:hypothetical protein